MNRVCFYYTPFGFLAEGAGLEPATDRVTTDCYYQLSYPSKHYFSPFLSGYRVFSTGSFSRIRIS